MTRWPEGRASVRRELTGTGLGDPEPAVELLGSALDGH